jgi:hypothetical protein
MLFNIGMIALNKNNIGELASEAKRTATALRLTKRQRTLPIADLDSFVLACGVF